VIAGQLRPFGGLGQVFEYCRCLFSSIPIRIDVVVCAIISIIATALLSDYTNRDISTEADYDEPL
jgi:hypothetical protein